ncbi:MAG: hypothetical protein GWP08_06290 [Nitrospiraceae bacterium]|nr:hypothetical protein [Nitrospiraceae bacterium]
MINGVPRILVVRLSAIGDVVRVLPALHALREAHPNAQIDWAVERKSAAVVEGHHALDRVLVFQRPQGTRESIRLFWRFCRQIRANRYDILIDFHGIFKSGMISAISGVADRYAFAAPRGQELSYLFANHCVKLPSQGLNRVEENRLLTDALCPRPKNLSSSIFVPLDIQEEVNAYFEETFDGGKLVVAMHVPVEREEKQWSVENYAVLADDLLADGRFEVLLTWGEGQYDLVQQVVRMTRRSPVIAPQTPDLKHYAWLAHRADLYFGGDTGPMHIAAAMDTPVVAVFGGTDPAKHAPYKRPCEILYCDEPGLSSEERLARITPDMAYEACVRFAV